MPNPLIAPPTTINVSAPLPPPMSTDNPQLSQMIQPQQTQAGPTPDQSPQTAPVHPIRAALGGWRALMGSHTEYNQTPQGPQAVQVNNKPGQLFRSILAGALLGGAAGGGVNEEQTAGSGYRAAAAGAGAAAQGQQRAQQQAQDSAQQQFQNQLTARREAREDSAAAEEQKRTEALIAQSNMETLKAHQLMQHEDYAFHVEQAKDDSARYSSYQTSGLKPVFSDVSETQMADLQKNNKNYTKYDWVNTGVKPGVDAQGHPTWESTYSAYDPKDAPNGIQLSQATIDQWKDDGLFKYHPEYEAQVKSGKTLSFDQFTALNMSAQKLATDANAKQLQTLNIKKEQAAINASNAEAAERYAAASKDRFELKEETLGKTQAEQFNNALNDLNTAGGDFSKLKPSSRVLIAESMQKMVPPLTAEYRDILTSDPSDSTGKAGAVLDQIQTLTSLGTRALGSITPKTPDSAVPSSPNYVDASGKPYALPKNQIAGFLAAHPGAKPIEPPAPPMTYKENRQVLKGAIENALGLPNIPVATP